MRKGRGKRKKETGETDKEGHCVNGERRGGGVITSGERGNGRRWENGSIKNERGKR